MPQLSAYAIHKPTFRFGVEDLNLVRTSPDMRLTASPFTHNADEIVFLGSAVPWKGLHGAKFWEEAEKHKGNPEKGQKGKTVAEGLRAAIEISKACRGRKGTIRVGGRLLPKKVVCQMERATKEEAA